MPSGANTEPLGFRKRVDIPIVESETAATFDMSSNNGVFLPAVDNSLTSNDNSAPPDPPEKETPRRERHHKRSRSKERNHRSSGAGREDRDRRRRSRSRDEDRDRDRGRDRHRDRDSYRDKDRDRDRRRSRSRDRERRHRRYSGDRNNDGSTLKDDAPLFGPVLPPTPNVVNVGYTGGTPFANDYGIPTTPGTPNSEGSEKGGKRKRKSRWSKETEKAFVPGMPTMIPTNLTDDQRRAYLLQLQIEDITRKLRTGDFGIPPNPENRSPSPEPVYDTHGKRLNTREVRTRQNLETSRHCMIQEMMKLNPHYKPPPDYKAPQSKLNAKVWIPQDENPEINFVGLLIGPRGNTLKELEKLTGSRIIIRGKGSVKEGKIAKRDGPLPGEDEPLHAYITATDPAAIDRAVNKINELITQALEIPDQENALRKDQLRQLALLNGTLRGDELALTNRCSNCGATTHKSWECPDRPNVTANVYCSACGSAGHLTKDCKNPRPGGVGGGGGMGSALDDEYSALMAELGQGDGDRIVSKQPIVRINLTKPRPPPLVGSGSTPIPPPWMGPPPPPMPPPWGWGPPMPPGMPMPPMPPMPPGMNMNPMMAPPPPPPPIDHNKNASHEDGDGMIPPPPPDYCPPPMMMGWPPMMPPMYQNPIPPPPPAPPSNLVGGDGDDYYAGLFGAAPPPPPPPPPNS